MFHLWWAPEQFLEEFLVLMLLGIMSMRCISRCVILLDVLLEFDGCTGKVKIVLLKFEKLR